MRAADCAHCGGLSRTYTTRNRGKVTAYYIKCINCKIETARYPTYEEAVKAWNRRPNDMIPKRSEKL